MAVTCKTSDSMYIYMLEQKIIILQGNLLRKTAIKEIGARIDDNLDMFHLPALMKIDLSTLHVPPCRRTMMHQGSAAA